MDLKLYFQKFTGQFKNLSWYLAASLLSSVIGLVFNPFLAKNLSSLDYSIIGYYNSFNSLFLPILNFSLVSFYVRKYFKIPDENRQDVCDTIITALVIWGSIAMLLVLVGFYGYCRISNVEFPFFPFAIITVATAFFNNFLLVYQVNCRMRREAKKYFMITISAALITLVLSILLVIILKLGALGRLSSALISGMIIAIFCMRKSLFRFHINFRVVKEAVSFGWPVSLASMIQYFTGGVAMALVAPIGDVDTMGLFVVGSGLGGYLGIFHTALTQTFEPDIYKSVADYNYKNLVKVISMVCSILVCIIVCFCLLAKPITAVLTYNRYTDAYHFAQIISISCLTVYLMSATKMVLNAFGFTKAVLLNQIITAALSYGMYVLLIDMYKYDGASWGMVISPLLVFVVGVIELICLRPKIRSMRLKETSHGN